MNLINDIFDNIPWNNKRTFVLKNDNFKNIKYFNGHIQFVYLQLAPPPKKTLVCAQEINNRNL